MSKFHISQDFGDRRGLKHVGPMIKAEWRVTPETENNLKSKGLPVPAPIQGYLVVDTGFAGIAIDGDVTQELNLVPIGKAKVQGVEGDNFQNTFMALLLLMIGNVNGENLAIGVPVEAACLPKIRASYDTYKLTTSEGTPLRVIGVLGRDFLQFTKLTYDGLNGKWDMEIDTSAMRSHQPSTKKVEEKSLSSPKHVVAVRPTGPPAFRAERYVITVEIGAKRHKLLQIMFAKKDGSLFINFPYFKHSEGLTSLVTIPANISYPTDAELNPGGKATSHLVKYSHHPDGRAHFSQDGRVRSTVRKQAVPLTEATEHLFTVQLQGLSEFEPAEPRDDSAPVTMKRKTVNFKFHDIDPEALKIVGRWYSRSQVANKVKNPVNSPIIRGMTEDGQRLTGVLLANPFPVKGGEYVLLLTCEPIPLMGHDRPASLSFMGGFDPPEIVNDPSKETSFLAFTYPVSNIEELAKEIGSIDLNRTD